MFVVSHLILQKIVDDITIIAVEDSNLRYYFHSYITNLFRSSSMFCLFVLLLNFFYCVFADPGFVPLNLVPLLFISRCRSP